MARLTRPRASVRMRSRLGDTGQVVALVREARVEILQSFDVRGIILRAETTGARVLVLLTGLRRPLPANDCVSPTIESSQFLGVLATNLR